MSVLVSIKFPGDTAAFRTALEERKEDFARHSAAAREAGGIHHRYGIGNGFVLVMDEWQSMADFERFFADPELQSFIGTVGADTSAAPEITVTEPVDSPDQY